MAMTLWGFDGSTYVRTVRMLFSEKHFTDFEQVPLNVLKGEPQTPEHKARHPFGKVPVLDHDGFRILETTAIIRYLNDVVPGVSLVPSTPHDRARMDMAIALLDSYGYLAMVNVAGYYVFPEFVGGKSEANLKKGIEDSRKVLEVMETNRAGAPFLAGGELSLADLFLAPLVAYLEMTPDMDAVMSVGGMNDWWTRMKARPSFDATKMKG